MSPVLANVIVMISRYAIMACTFNLVGVAMQPLKAYVDSKVIEMENNMEAQASTKGEN